MKEESVEQLRCAAQSCKEREISILTSGNQGKLFKKKGYRGKESNQKVEVEVGWGWGWEWGRATGSLAQKLKLSA